MLICELTRETESQLSAIAATPKLCLFDILMGLEQPDEGEFKFGKTVTQSYFPKEHDSFFTKDLNLIDWLRSIQKKRKKILFAAFWGVCFSQETSP